jgi:hypothetical protein
MISCDLPERFALQRCVKKNSIAIRPEQKVNRSIAQSADSVEKQYVSFPHQVPPDSIGLKMTETMPPRINDSAGNGYGLQPSAPSAKRST